MHAVLVKVNLVKVNLVKVNLVKVNLVKVITVLLNAAPARFAPYETSHLAVLLLLAAATVAFLLAARLGGSTVELYLSRVLATAILGALVPFQVYSMLGENWSLERSLPFELCDLAWIAGAFALLTGRRWASALLYYWGLSLTPQAIITPRLEYDFPHPQFLMFWSSHALTVLAAIYVTFGRKRHGFRPGWKDFRFAIAVTAVWEAFVLTFNEMAETNYMFLNAKPDTPSILDLLGPWPWYLLSEAVLLVVIWALMTWPWQRAGERSRV